MQKSYEDEVLILYFPAYSINFTSFLAEFPLSLTLNWQALCACHPEFISGSPPFQNSICYLSPWTCFSISLFSPYILAQPPRFRNKFGM